MKPHGTVEKAIAAGQAAHDRLCASSDPIIAGHAKATGYPAEREPPTITEALVDMREALDRGMVLSARKALSDLEDAVRRLQAAAPTAAIVAFLRAEETKYRMALHETTRREVAERHTARASILATMAAYIERGDYLTNNGG